jgi:Putative Actinobacterial Holin-X, holin superfamily III
MTEPNLTTKARMKLSGLVNEGTREVGTLIRRELDLVKQEIAGSAKQAAKGAGLAGGAAGAGAMTVLFGSLAVWQGLAKRIGPAPAAVVIAGLYGGAAAMLAARAKVELGGAGGAPRRLATLGEHPIRSARAASPRTAPATPPVAGAKPGALPAGTAAASSGNGSAIRPEPAAAPEESADPAD